MSEQTPPPTTPPEELPEIKNAADLLRSQLADMMARSHRPGGESPAPEGEPATVNQHPAMLAGMYRAAGLPRRPVKWLESNYRQTTVEGAKMEGLFAADDSTVILLGGTGTGKTCAAVAYAMHLVQKGKRVRYLTLATLCDLLEEARTQGGEDGVEFVSVRAAITTFCEYDLLVIDEAQSGRETDATIRNLSTIVTGRHDNLRPTVLVTNAEPERLTEIFTNPIMDRAKCIEFNSHSYRQ